MKYINKEKLNNISLNANNFYIAIDFDRTITSYESPDSWDATGKVLGEKFNEKMFELYKKYRPIELDYNIKFEEKNIAMEKWYKECMNLYYEYKLTKVKLEDSINSSNLNFRDGAKDFLIEANKNKIPVIILSAGIGNVIKEFLKSNNCYFENMFIISNFIEFDENGNMIPFKNELIHTLNKTMEGHLPEKLKNKCEQKEYSLLLGDLIEDKKMIEKSNWEKTILVSFLNEKIEENLNLYKNEFDIVLTKEDANFENVREIIQYL